VSCREMASGPSQIHDVPTNPHISEKIHPRQDVDRIFDVGSSEILTVEPGREKNA
jgi:hypothetical protein